MQLLFSCYLLISLLSSNAVEYINITTNQEQSAASLCDLRITLWFNSTIYQHTLSQPRANTTHTILSSFLSATTEPSNCNTPQIMLECDHTADSVLIDQISFKTSHNWYGISGYCISTAEYESRGVDPTYNTYDPICPNTHYYFDSICINNKMGPMGCAPSRQIFHFDNSRPNQYINNAIWSDGYKPFSATCNPTTDPTVSPIPNSTPIATSFYTSSTIDAILDAASESLETKLMALLSTYDRSIYIGIICGVSLTCICCCISVILCVLRKRKPIKKLKVDSIDSEWNSETPMIEVQSMTVVDRGRSLTNKAEEGDTSGNVNQKIHQPRNVKNVSVLTTALENAPDLPASRASDAALIRTESTFSTMFANSPDLPASKPSVDAGKFVLNTGGEVYDGGLRELHEENEEEEDEGDEIKSEKSMDAMLQHIGEDINNLTDLGDLVAGVN